MIIIIDDCTSIKIVNEPLGLIIHFHNEMENLVHSSTRFSYQEGKS